MGADFAVVFQIALICEVGSVVNVMVGEVNMGIIKNGLIIDSVHARAQ